MELEIISPCNPIESMILLGERACGGYITHPSLVTAVCTAFYLAVIKAVIHYITCVFFFKWRSCFLEPVSKVHMCLHSYDMVHYGPL